MNDVNTARCKSHLDLAQLVNSAFFGGGISNIATASRCFVFLKLGMLIPGVQLYWGGGCNTTGLEAVEFPQVLASKLLL